MTHETLKVPEFILLASASPRRKDLLAQLGLDVELAPVNLDESVRADETGAEYVQRLAREKSAAAWTGLGEPGAPVLAADTAVVLDEQILGKPAGRADAIHMLTQLSGRTHDVLTGVSVRAGSRHATALSRSSVTFRAISPAEIANYWQSGEPEGKAGAYAVQGLGAIFVEHLSGSYSGVMGLPLYETACLLNDFGYSVPFDHAKRNTD